MELPALLRDGVLDPATAALLWLLIEGRVPLLVAGPATAEQRAALAAALLSIDSTDEWVLVDADDGSLATERLTALLRGGLAFGATVTAADLEGVLSGLEEAGLPSDGIRRLGLVLILDEAEAGLRCTSVHYLRPTERDAQGHLQRRPPAVLAAWDGAVGAYEDYAWGITPELADRIDRSQADLEGRRTERARFLVELAFSAGRASMADQVTSYLATEPGRVPAPERLAARPSPFHGGLLDPDDHTH